MNSLQQFLYNKSAIDMTDEQIQELFKDKKVKVSFEDGLVLFKYDIEADFSDPVVKNCRGIILYRKDFSIACYPFDKFNNYDSKNADNIDWESASVEEKIDGSLIKVWYNKILDDWTVSTNGTIYAQATTNYKGINFSELFSRAESKLDYNILNKNYTYMFELISPDNVIVVHYNKTDIYHIGTRDNISQKEVNTYIGIQKPKKYDITRLENAVEQVNKLGLGHEGFVVVDKNYNRIKIKSTIYFKAHYLLSQFNTASPDKLADIVNKIDIDKLKEFSSELAGFVDKTKDKIKRERQYLFESITEYQKDLEKFKKIFDTHTRKEYYKLVNSTVLNKMYILHIMRVYDGNVTEYIDKISDGEILKIAINGENLH